jgi:membrane-bound metal-dependent hydrolase YbcI (DUF457 family)
MESSFRPAFGTKGIKAECSRPCDLHEGQLRAEVRQASFFKTMPEFKIHFVWGLGFGILASLIFGSPIFCFIAIIYSLAPDLDIGNSIPFRWYTLSASAYAIYMLITPQDFQSKLFGLEFPQRYFAIPPLLLLIGLQFIQHREFFHSLIAGILFSIPVAFFLGWQGFIVACLAFYLHLALDSELLDGLWT